MGSIGVNRDSIRFSFLDTPENVGQTNNTDKTGRYDDFRFSSMDSSTAPTKSSSIGETLKAGLKSIHHKIADSFIGKALEAIETKILSFVADVKERRLENQTALLKTSPEGPKIESAATSKSSTFLPLLETVRPHGSAGVRICAESMMSKACKDRVGTGPLDPLDDKDKQIINGLAESILSQALSQNPGGGQTIDAAKTQISEFVEMIVGAHTKSTPDSLKSLLTVFNHISTLLADESSIKDFLAERLETEFSRLAGNGGDKNPAIFENTFMRANSTITVLTARIGGQGLYAGLDDVRNDVHSVVDKPKNLQKVLQSIEDDSYPGELTREQVAEARIDIAIQILDAAIGKNGEKVIERLGDDGKTQLRETGEQIIRLAKENGLSNEQTNAVVRKYYQNVIFLRGISPQITAAYVSNEQLPDYDRVGSRVVTNATKDLTILFNELDPMQSIPLKEFPELQTALTTTNIPERLLKLYSDLDIPTAEQVEADAIETAEKLSLILNQGSQPNNVGGQYSDELNALLRSIDNPEIDPEGGDYEVEGQIDNPIETNPQGGNVNSQVSSNVPVEQNTTTTVRRETVVEPTLEDDVVEEEQENEETTASENNALLVELRQRVIKGEKLEPAELRLLDQLQRMDISNRAN